LETSSSGAADRRYAQTRRGLDSCGSSCISAW